MGPVIGSSTDRGVARPDPGAWISGPAPAGYPQRVAPVAHS